MIDHIIDGIYISDAISVISSTHQSKLLELGIERIMTVSALPINEANRLPGIQYKFVFMMDMTNQDILGDNLLEDAIAYIEQAVHDNVNILVHCEVGVSRSVTVVAAYLMRRFEWSGKKAVYFIKDKRPTACPNSSFLTQLDIFAYIGYKANSNCLASSPLYRNFCADVGIIPKTGQISRMSHNPASTSVYDPCDPRNAPRAQLHDEKAPEVIAAQHIFRCRKCRTDLFYDTHVLYHARKSSGTTAENNDQITSLMNRCVFEYFVTPLNWMKIDEHQGKINCPKCGEKIGHFNWSGNLCQGSEHEKCTTHVSPWFHIQRSKVDKFSTNPTNRSTIGITIPTVVIN